jgi:nucleoside-diphosphate-sugar epimerase
VTTTIFIAGATGVLGRATVPRLVAAGHTVRGAARSEDKAAQLRAQGAEPVTVDLFDPESVRRAVDGCEVAIHMATSIPPLSKGWRTSAWKTNDRLRREGTRILADVSRDQGVKRLVKESVCFFYVPRGAEWIDENSPIDEQPFSASSLEAERTAVGFGDGDRVGIALRFGLFYSADARATEENLSVARRGIGPMIGRAESYQPSIHVDDAAAAIVAALGAPSGYYNVADEPITKGEWNDAFAEVFGLDKKLRETPKAVLKAGGKKMVVLAGGRRVSSQKFRAATGWEPQYANAAIGLKTVAAEWKQRNSG